MLAAEVTELRAHMDEVAAMPPPPQEHLPSSVLRRLRLSKAHADAK